MCAPLEQLVFIVNDAMEEPDETIILSLTGPGISLSATVVIFDNDGRFILTVQHCQCSYYMPVFFLKHRMTS